MSATLPDMIPNRAGEDVRRAAAGQADGLAADGAGEQRTPRMLAGRDPGASPMAQTDVGPSRPARQGAAATIGSRIRALRRARGLTQDTLALSTGVSRSAVAQWETGRAGQMSGKLRRIAEALGVSVNMLRDGWEGLATDSVLSTEEMSLLRLFRLCEPDDRAVLMHVAQKLAEPPASE